VDGASDCKSERVSLLKKGENFGQRGSVESLWTSPKSAIFVQGRVTFATQDGFGRDDPTKTKTRNAPAKLVRNGGSGSSGPTEMWDLAHRTLRRQIPNFKKQEKGLPTDDVLFSKEN